MVKDTNIADPSHIEHQIATAAKAMFMLENIKDIPILDPKRISELKEVSRDLSESFSKLQIGRSKYLMEVSVLKDVKFPTPDSKYWQCVLERNGQFQNLMFSILDFEEKVTEVEEKETLIENLLSESESKLRNLRIKKLNVQRKRLLLQLVFTKKEAEERHREIMGWTELIADLVPQLKYPIEDPEAHMPESFLIKMAEQQKIIEQIGAADMNGALNIIGLGQTASKYWKEKEKKVAL